MASSVGDDEFKLLLVGKTGTGKSSTGNSILGRNEFKSFMSATSVTKTIKRDYAHVNGRKVMVVDGPGLADTDMTDAKCMKYVSKQMETAVAQCPDGYHAILIIIGLSRLTEEDRRTVNQLDGIFGSDYVNDYGILVITHGENYDSEENDGISFEEWCSKQGGVFKELRERCRERIVLFQNKSKDSNVKDEQLEKLFDLISHMKQNSSRYTPQLFKNAQTARDETLLKSKAPVITQKIEQKLSLIRQAIKNRSDIPVLRKNRAEIDYLIKDIKKQGKDLGVLSELSSTLETLGGMISNKISLIEKEERDREKEQQLERQLETYREKLEKLETREYERRVQTVLNVMNGLVGAASGITDIVKTGVQTHKLRKGN